MVTFIVLSIIFSILSLIISAWTLIYLRKAVKKEHEHIQKLFETTWKLKDHLQKQMGAVENKLNEHVKDHGEWQAGIKKWLDGELQKQHIANENAVARTATAVDAISKNRESIAKSFGQFLALLRAELRTEKVLLDGVKPTPPGNPANTLKSTQ